MRPLTRALLPPRNAPVTGAGYPFAVAAPTTSETRRGTVPRPRSGRRRSGPPRPADAELDPVELKQLDAIRRFGTVGALLMGLGSLGAGTAPVLGNPVIGKPVLGLFIRMPTASLALAYTGIFMVVLAWLWLGALTLPNRRRLPSRGQLDRTLLMWTVPLLLTPPMFSRDVYSYIAQSAMADRDLDPYRLGVAEALGVDHPLTRGVPNIWRDTPAPYGPLFLTIGRPITKLTGDDVVSAVILHRLLVLIGVAMIFWALPRLARRAGVCEPFALWLGAMNPLVLFHLVSGVHNEALMLGLMLVGLELALRRPAASPALVGGIVLIAASSMIKVPSALALVFVAVWLGREWGGRLRDLVRALALVVGAAVATVLGLTFGSGLGFGWISALGTPGDVRSWMSIFTDLGLLSARIGASMGLGDHTDATLNIAHAAGLLAAAFVTWLLLRRCWRGQLSPLAGLGIALGAVVLLGPVIHPWYLTWAVVPLAAAVTPTGFRIGATLVSSYFALVTDPTGNTFVFREWVLPTAVISALVIVAIPLLIVGRRMPSPIAVLGPGYLTRPDPIEPGRHA